MKDFESRLEALERDNRKTKRVVALRRSTRLAGLGAGVAIYVLTGFGDVVGNAVQGAATVYHDGKIALQAFNAGRSDKELVSNYVVRLPDVNQKEFYEAYSNDNFLTKIGETSREIIDSAGRESERFPGAQSTHVKSLRGAKESIISSTKKLFGKDASEVEITKEPQYATNYNELAKLRTETMHARNEVYNEMGRLCKNMERNELAGHDIDKGMQELTSLTNSYNGLSRVLENMGSLNIRQIEEGRKNIKYHEAIEDASTYGVVPFDGSNYHTFGAIAGGVIAGGAGYRISRYADDVISTSADFAKGIVGLTRGVLGLSVKVGKTVKPFIVRTGKTLMRNLPEPFEIFRKRRNN